MKIYQNKAGVYLPDECQPVSNKWQKYRPHESVRYVFVKDSENEKKLPELYAKREECCGCGACYAVCPLSGDDRPIRAKRNIERKLNGEDGYNFSCQIGKNLVKDYIHTGAITLLPDEEGFLYPVVDAEICIRCYKCINACPNH